MPYHHDVRRPVSDGNHRRDGAIDRSSFIPLHAQVKNNLQRQILAGTLAPGSALPSEAALCRGYSVSRITVRRALADLEADGLVRRVAGRGTYVAAEAERFGPTIGVLFGGLTDRTFGYHNDVAFGDMIGGAAEAASRRNASVYPLPLEEDGLKLALATPATNRVDGLLVHLARAFTEPMLATLDDAARPYVVVKRRLGVTRASSVFSDDRSGAAAITRHLVERGHRRIALILGPAEIGVWEDRRLGFQSALADAGIPEANGLVERVGYPMDEAGYGTALRLLRAGRCPTAVFAGNDYIAVGVYRAIREAGLEPGRDIGVAGYGANAFSAMLHPTLTTVGTSGWDLGNAAADLLLDIIEGSVQAPAQRELPWHLEIRQSSSMRLQGSSGDYVADASGGNRGAP